jgi:hypothetical protein
MKQNYLLEADSDPTTHNKDISSFVEPGYLLSYLQELATGLIFSWVNPRHAHAPDLFKIILNKLLILC